MKIILNGDLTELPETTLFGLRDSKYPDADLMIVDGAVIDEDMALEDYCSVYFGRSPKGNGDITEAISVRNTPGTYECLQKATVGIAGAGGLGSNIATCLARSGIGKLIIADCDRVDLSNLNRQAYNLSHLAQFKVDAIEDVVSSINPVVAVETHAVRLDSINVPSIFARCDVICEALDGPEAKAMFLQTVKEKLPDIPLICGSGMAGTDDPRDMKVRRLGGNTYICGDETSEHTAENGIMAPRVMICAGLMANKTIQLISKRE